MMTIKRVFLVAVVVFLLGPGLCFAGSAIPNLVGTWTVKSEGGVLLRGSDLGAKTHHNTGGFSILEADVVIAKQQGRVLHGTFKSQKASEDFVAVIGYDNRSLHFADGDGFFDGKLLGTDKLEVVYRHVTAMDTVVAVGIWTRKKP